MSETSLETTEGRVTSLDELGPVDYIVVEFPAGASNFTGEMAQELVRLVETGTIRLIDVLILTKNEDGSVEAMELSDFEELGELHHERRSAALRARHARPVACARRTRQARAAVASEDPLAQPLQAISARTSAAPSTSARSLP